MAPIPEVVDPQKTEISTTSIDKELYSQNFIMSRNFSRPASARRLIGNNNVLIIGGAGTGKSRNFIKPNILDMNTSFVCTDPSGEIINSLGQVLIDHKYNIKIFNISEMSCSNCYNPFKYIRDEAGVDMLIECFITNTTSSEGGGGGNEYFVNAEKLLYAACIYYLRDYCTDESKKNFGGIYEMVLSAGGDEGPNAKESTLDRLFLKLPLGSLARNNYEGFKKAPAKTLNSIISSAIVRLRPFGTPQLKNLTRTDNLDLERLGMEKTALFIITPQADATYTFLASMLYSQLFETLYYIGGRRKLECGDERMPVQVRMFMDEFANTGRVPNFPRILSTCRKYDISVTIALQDLSQLETLYSKDQARTIEANCSTMVLLGTQELETLKFCSEKLGKMTIRVKSDNQNSSGEGAGYQHTGREVRTADEIGRMPPDRCIIYTQNRRAVYDYKYDYVQHPYYPYTGDADSNRAFDYSKISIYNNQKRDFSSIMLARSEAARIRNRQIDFKDAEEIIIQGDPKQIMDSVTLGEATDEQIYKKKCSLLFKQSYDDDNDVCVLSVVGVAPQK